MSIAYRTTVNAVGDANSPLSRQLIGVFENLADEGLLGALEATRWTGRPGYPLQAMWRTYVASYVLNISTFTGLIRALRDNPLLAAACGIDNPDEIPSKYAYCRFLKKLTRFRADLDGCMAALSSNLAGQLPGFGETVAIDSTDLKAHSNGSKPVKSDPDASWSRKRGSNGKEKW